VVAPPYRRDAEIDVGDLKVAIDLIESTDTMDALRSHGRAARSQR